MFKKTQNIETAFQHVRTYTIVLTIGYFITIGVYEYFRQRSIAAYQDRIYLLFNEKVLEAVAIDRKEKIEVEARDHVKTFHRYFFSLAPDDKVIKANMNQALYLADESAKKEYDNLSESGYFSNIIAGNISQQIDFDSVKVDVRQEPYRFKCYATERIIRTTSTVVRTLVTQGEIRKVTQSDNNPHGLLIQRWTTLENKDKEVINH